MKNTFYTKIIIASFFTLASFQIGLAQQEPKPDLAEARILCDKRTITIDQMIGAGVEANEADDGCLKDATETNTAWFSWESANEGILNFTIQPENPSDRFSFALFTLEGINQGTNKVAIRCALPCRTGAIGLRADDIDFIIDDCATAADGFMRFLSMEEGGFYGLMVENTTSNGGFTISFSGDGEFVGPEGEILPSATEACFGSPITFNENIAFKNGTINSYAWSVENTEGQIEESQTTQVSSPQTFNFQTIGTKTISLSVVSSVEAVPGQTCMATFELPIIINSCCDSDNKVEIVNSTISEIKCPDDTNGEIDIEVVSSNPAFPTMYFWSTGETTEDLDSLSDGTYSVTVVNDAGCKDSLSHTFVIPNALTAVETVTNPSCGGLADGVISVEASGGRMPYTYDFGDGNGFVINSTLNGLDTGDYEVVVMDDSGCTFTLEAIELDDKNLEISFDTMPITCFGADDGQVIITNPLNGTAPFFYDFNDGNGRVGADALSNLAPGIYSIDVYDSEGCTGNPVEFQLVEPTAFTAAIGESRKFCNGQDDGYAVAVTEGGEGTLSYEWNNGATEKTANDLLAGVYSVTVTDENGCKAESETIELSDPPLLVATVANTTDVTCSSESDGAIELEVNGGIMPYEYSLDGINFQVGTTASNLETGDYAIVVKDNFGCIANTEMTTIKSPEALSFEVNADENICYGNALTFTNTSTFSRGTPVNVSWEINGTVVEEDAPEVTFTQIGKPTVSLTIQTDLGCTATITEELAIAVEPCCAENNINFFPFVEEPLCAEDTDGSITLNAFSNAPITSIAWNNNATTDFIENLPAGEYTVTVTNDATCDSITSITLEAPEPISAILAITNPTCDVAINGAISATAMGGTVSVVNDYEFDFGDGFSAQNSIDALSVGNYAVTVRDDNNCMKTIDTVLTVPEGFEAIRASFDLTTPSCEVATNGAIAVTANGEAGNFQYDFGNGFSTENTLENIPVGNYTITIQDGDNCTFSKDTTLTVPEGFEAIRASFELVNPTCDAANNGAIRVTASGEGGAFQYDFGNGLSNESSISDLPIGTYTITIQDSDNCTFTKDTSLVVPEDFNPITATLEIKQPSCDEATNGIITVNASGDGGNFQYDFGAGFSDENSNTDLTAGNYSVIVRDNDNCTLLKDTVLAAAPNVNPVQATLQISQPSCGGEADGAITVLPSGELGTDLANYEFDFGNGASTSNVLENLAVGSYLVVVRNADNCSISLDTVLSEKVLSTSFLVTRPSCFGLSDGGVRFDVPNGTAPFTYDFGDSNFQEEAALSNLPEGTYTIRVQDSEQCLSEIQEVLIDQPDELVLNLESTDISCFGENDGRIVANVSGGVGNYAYNWSNGATGNIAGMLSAGEYILEVTDGNDCSVNGNVVTIVEPAQLFASIAQVDNVLCFGDTDGQITVEANGGSAPFEYSLDGIIFQDVATLMGLSAGNYSVIVKDSRACEITTESVQVEEPEEFVVTASTDTEVAKLGVSVNLSAQANVSAGGNVDYTWMIPDSVICTSCQSFELIPPGSTIFTVTAVNQNGCQATDQVKVAVSLDRPVYIPNIFSPNGDGINDEFYIPFSPAMTAIKELKIFDRTGAMVFEAYDIRPGEEFAKSWDGEFDGQKIRQGVFVVMAQISFVDNQTLPFESDLTLITSR